MATDAEIGRLQAQLQQLERRVAATEKAIEEAVERVVDARIKVLEQRLGAEPVEEPTR